ncbi:protein prib [Colletotrichum asianum]
MSGFEIAGLALGAFPLLIEGAKELEGFAKKFEFYWEFRTKFESFIADVNVCRLQDIAKALNDLRELFPVDKARLLHTQDVEGATYRLATSFSSQKDELLAKLKKNNEEIHRYLDESSKVISTVEPPSKTIYRDQAEWKKYRKLQNQAQDLFNSFREHWSAGCTCSNGHPCGITVQKLKEEDGRKVSIVLMFNPLSDVQGLQRRIRVDGGVPLQDNVPYDPAGNDHPVGDQDKLNELSQRVSASNSKRKLMPKQKGFIRRLWRRLFGKRKDLVPVKDHENQKAYGPLTNIGLPSGASPKKPSHGSGSNNQDSQAKDSSRNVQFNLTNDVSSGLLKENGASKPIQSLCMAIGCKDIESCLGYLEFKNKQRIYFHSAPLEQPSYRFEVETLNSVIHNQIYRAERLSVGLSTVRLVASIGDSPWLSVSWSPVDLNLLRDPDTSVLQPYVVHESLLQTLKRMENRNIEKQGRSNLFTLGIILLELLFGEKLESHPAHSIMLKDSSSRELTDFCTAMKWQEDVEPALGKPLADAIAWCLLCFRNPGKGIGTPGCLEDMWQHVVLPLERFLSTWH